MITVFVKALPAKNLAIVQQSFYWSDEFHFEGVQKRVISYGKELQTAHLFKPGIGTPPKRGTVINMRKFLEI